MRKFVSSIFLRPDLKYGKVDRDPGITLLSDNPSEEETAPGFALYRTASDLPDRQMEGNS